ncbi:MAG: type VI secretion system tube protein Hcp [Actinobacteria bacterium]|nr:type VI secretion system tube protein Hcp [Actinomycetota bacterium]
MGFRALSGRSGKAALLLVLGAAAGAAATAIAAVPGTDGVINACYEVQRDGVTPLTGAPNVRIIDPSAGQTCNPPGAPAQAEHALSWNVTGPAGPQGAAGSPGAQGAAGPAGATVSIGGQTFTLGDGKTLTGPTTPIPPLQVKPGAPPVATITLAAAGGAISSGILAWQLVNPPSAAARGIKGIQIVKHLDKSSPTLLKWCVTGKHIKSGKITVRAAGANGGPQTITFTDATVDSYSTDEGKGKGKSGTDRPTETISLNFSSVKVE